MGRIRIPSFPFACPLAQDRGSVCNTACSSSFLFDPEETERQPYPRSSFCSCVCGSAQWDSWLLGFSCWR